jgi:asparagine synthase (glutamine-hydrolysing)
MCGIAGMVNLAAAPRDFSAAVRRMMAAERHRGPDAEGFYCDDVAHLGHRRLSIIDLSEAANQPMTDASGRYVLTFNGEIYNHEAIRARLHGYPFRTHSDTEVIVAAFATWGPAAVSELTGQFAFAIWDRQARKLFIARDRLGEKPLYYHYARGEHFAFASELRALLASDVVPRRISRDAVADYLVHESVRSPGTILVDVHQLPAAHYAWVTRDGVSAHQYWSIVPTERSEEPRDYEAVRRRVRELLGEATVGQMVSDVPLGVFLSGGIDSSAIAGLMASLSGRTIDTVSVTFDEGQFDESRHSQTVATRFGTRHHVIKLAPTRLLEELPAFFESVDAPSGDGPNTYVVAKAAKGAGLTVALSGVGGDELFGGYSHFRWYSRYRKHGYLWRTPRRARQLLAPTARLLMPNINTAKLGRLATLEHSDAAGFYELARSAYFADQAASITRSGAYEQHGAKFGGADGHFAALAPASQLSVLELTGYTQNVLLKDTDNLAMASSLEVRVPFCDYRLVEYVLGVPDRFKYGKTPKKLLIDAVEGLLPESIVHRPKMGFSFPWSGWIRNELRDFCQSNLTSLGDRGLIDRGHINATWNAFLQRPESTPWSRIWLLVALEQWIRKTGATPE